MEDTKSTNPDNGQVTTLLGNGHLTALMIDMEFLALSPNAYPLSIGACIFTYDDTEPNIDVEFYRNIIVPQEIGKSFVMSHETVMWWLQQGEQARTRLTHPAAHPLHEVLAQFNSWLKSKTFRHVWSRGHIDMDVLANCYGACGMQIPFGPKQWRDCRTLDDFTMGAFDNEMQATLTAHDALDDAIKQALIIKHVYNRFPVVLRELQKDGPV